MSLCKKVNKREHPKEEDLSPIKVGLIVGHTRLAKGATNVKGHNEYDMYSKLVAPVLKKTLEIDGMDAVIITRDIGGIKGAYDKAEKELCDCVIELHFNAASKESIDYTVTLCSKDKQDYEFSKHIQKAMCRYMLRQNQDTKIWKLSRSDRGGRSVTSFKGPNCLIEPFFGTSKTGTDRFYADIPGFCDEISKGIEGYFNG